MFIAGDLTAREKRKKNSNIETKYKYCPLKIMQKNLGNLEICSGKVTWFPQNVLIIRFISEDVSEL